ncbi:MAG: glycosyltransferase [Chromatiaceae bacterium]|nr:glycosyltransferase [Chromatiaceae bacterium]
MKILGYGIYQDHALGGDVLLAKGLTANGCKVEPYDFKKYAKSLGAKAADALLLEQSAKADLVLIGKGERLCPAVLKQVAAKVPVALWYGDIRPQVPDYLQQLLPHVNYFFMTSAGETLRQYHKLGVRTASAYMINPFDPDLVLQKSHLKKDLDVVFTGTGYRFAGDERQQIISYLTQRGDVTFFGGADKFTGNKLSPWQKLRKELSRLDPRRKVRGEAYFDVIRRAKIGIGINAVHHVPRYTSDRLTHYTGFGSFILTHNFTGLRELFAADEVVAYDNVEQLAELINYYLQNEQEREQIARRAQQRVLQDYNCTNVTGLLLDIIKTGRSDRFEWVDIVD